MKDGEVIIVDEFTGRQMPGRRWSDGLHQAVEAKEGVKIERENQTLATITFQNYFRMYKKLSGMTGTAETEAAEFGKIYNLDVVVIPTNRTLIREEHRDVVYRTEKEKFEAVVNGILQEDNSLRQRHPPLSTSAASPSSSAPSPSKNPKPSRSILKKAGVPHQVLNAKQHERESRIVAQAGRKGAVTVATNMAGRGTDILLGGNPEQMTRDHFLKNKLAMPYAAAPAVIPADGAAPPRQSAQPSPMVLFQNEGKIFQVPADQWKPIYEQFAQQCKAEHDEVVALGGLHILGTERHEARRIDNQLRGRAGRQGDPGSSRFFLSLEDDLMRIFGGERIKALMYRLGMTEGVPIESEPDFATHRKRAEIRRSAKLRRPQTPARIRRRDEQAARNDLRHSPLRARRKRPARLCSRRCRRRRPRTRRHTIARASSIPTSGTPRSSSPK